ncbi:uncharacterized protein LOC130927204 [Corythoichthys intestinalis]|uniref:uncharacterized protein LOC130911327 n=1 Tax=Corythoichthys intestinalis TaxID=161448 RepID=UPI0025A530FD|nr:uncharacterized protein LOC130911327 [Corythoichthys intestinalis]XP_057708842.1 uncharacterized protein LOC130927204 [Corythoichthys intestinalis]
MLTLRYRYVDRDNTAESEDVVCALKKSKTDLLYQIQLLLPAVPLVAHQFFTSDGETIKSATLLIPLPLGIGWPATVENPTSWLGTLLSSLLTTNTNMLRRQLPVRQPRPYAQRTWHQYAKRQDTYASRVSGGASSAPSENPVVMSCHSLPPQNASTSQLTSENNVVMSCHSLPHTKCQYQSAYISNYTPVSCLSGFTNNKPTPPSCQHPLPSQTCKEEKE